MQSRPRFQFSLRLLMLEVLLAGIALGLSRLLFAMDIGWTGLAGSSLLLGWLVLAVALICRSWRVVSGWGMFVSVFFVILGGPHAVGPLFYWFYWIASESRPWRLVQWEFLPLVAGGFLLIAAECSRRKRIQSCLGVAAVACLAGFVMILAPLRFYLVYKQAALSLVPVIAFGTLRTWIDVTRAYQKSDAISR